MKEKNFDLWKCWIHYFIKITIRSRMKEHINYIFVHIRIHPYKSWETSHWVVAIMFFYIVNESWLLYVSFALNRLHSQLKKNSTNFGVVRWFMFRNLLSFIPKCPNVKILHHQHRKHWKFLKFIYILNFCSFSWELKLWQVK